MWGFEGRWDEMDLGFGEVWAGFGGSYGNFWLWRGGGAVLLQFFNGLKAAVVGTFGAGFVAEDEFRGVVAGGFFKSEGEAAVLVHFLIFAFVEGFDVGDVEIGEGDFDGGEAHDLPHIGGDEGDEVVFDFVAGGEAGDVSVDVSGEGVLIFGVDADVGSAEAVGHVGVVDFEFAFGGGGSGRLGAVEAGGVGLGGGAAGSVGY